LSVTRARTRQNAILLSRFLIWIRTGMWPKRRYRPSFPLPTTGYRRRISFGTKIISVRWYCINVRYLFPQSPFPRFIRSPPECVATTSTVPSSTQLHSRVISWFPPPPTYTHTHQELKDFFYRSPNKNHWTHTALTGRYRHVPSLIIIVVRLTYRPSGPNGRQVLRAFEMDMRRERPRQ